MGDPLHRLIASNSIAMIEGRAGRVEPHDFARGCSPFDTRGAPVMTRIVLSAPGGRETLGPTVSGSGSGPLISGPRRGWRADFVLALRSVPLPGLGPADDASALVVCIPPSSSSSSVFGAARPEVYLVEIVVEISLAYNEEDWSIDGRSPYTRVHSVDLSAFATRGNFVHLRSIADVRAVAEIIDLIEFDDSFVSADVPYEDTGEAETLLGLAQLDGRIAGFEVSPSTPNPQVIFEA